MIVISGSGEVLQVQAMREILEEGAIVRYTGEYENCHGADYIVTKVFSVFGIWYDLKLKNPWVPGGPYAEIYSAPGHQVLGVIRSQGPQGTAT